MQTPRFALASEDCELLLAFESHPRVPALAKALRRDPSVVSRRLRDLASRAPVLEKSGPHWRLTALGRTVNRWSAEAASEQARLLGEAPRLRLGATRTFATKALVPGLAAFAAAHPDAALAVYTFEPGLLERALLDGAIDVAIACGTPTDPLIAHKRGVPERFVTVATGGFLRRFAIKRADDLFAAPHLAFHSPHVGSPFADVVARATRVAGTFDDLLCVAEAALAGQGWGIVPYYVAKAALSAGTLREAPQLADVASHYGVWWLRERRSLAKSVGIAARWLRAQEL